MKKELQLARDLLLRELTGTTQGQGSLFRVDYPLLVRIAQLVRLEGKHALATLLEEIAKQRPNWRFEEETGQVMTYWTAMQFAERHRDLLHLEAWLTISPGAQEVAATLHLGNGSLFLLVRYEKSACGDKRA